MELFAKLDVIDLLSFLKLEKIFINKRCCICFNYDKKLVQGTFLHTLYQGLNERNSHVRRDLKPFLSDTQVSDDFLLEQITKSTSEEEGRLKRLSTAKTRPVTVSAAQHDSDDQTNQIKLTKVAYIPNFAKNGRN